MKWLRFAARARKKFGKEIDLNWERVGQKVMKRFEEEDGDVLTWKLGAEELDIDQLVMINRDMASTRARRKGIPNAS
jgi:hypothetical protein